MITDVGGFALFQTYRAALFYSLLFQPYTSCANIPSYLKLKQRLYTVLSFSLGRATGSGPVGDMDAFLFLQLTYKGHVVRIFFPSTSSLCMLECSALVLCSVTLIERLVTNSLSLAFATVMFELPVVAFEPH